MPKPENKMTYAQKFAKSGGEARAKLPNIAEIREKAAAKTWRTRHEDMRRIAAGLPKMTKAQRIKFHATNPA